MDRVVGLLSSTDHGKAAAVRGLRRRALRILSEVAALHWEAVGRQLADCGSGAGVRLFSAMVMLLASELLCLDEAAGEYNCRQEQTCEHEAEQIVREIVQLLWVYAQHLRDISAHVQPVRHLFVGAMTRLMNRQAPASLWDLADTAFCIQTVM